MRIGYRPPRCCRAAQAAPALPTAIRFGAHPLAAERARCASPITDHFCICAALLSRRSCDTDLRLDPSSQPACTGTLLSAEHDLGLKQPPEPGADGVHLPSARAAPAARRLFRSRPRRRPAARAPSSSAARPSPTAISCRATINSAMLELHLHLLVHPQRALRGGRGPRPASSAGAMPRGTDVTAAEQRQEASGVGAFPDAARSMRPGASRSALPVTARGQYLSATINGVSGCARRITTRICSTAGRQICVRLRLRGPAARLPAGRAPARPGFDLSVSGPEAFLRVSF